LAFLALSLLEIVLGIDNIIFIALLVARLPPRQQRAARLGGLALAMLTRIGLLLCVVWLTRLVQPWLQVAGHSLSARDLILLAGGMFLLGKSVLEIHRALEGPVSDAGTAQVPGSLTAIIAQIGLIDIVFSLDSVFTAIGLANRVEVMVGAIIVSVAMMMLVSSTVSGFIERHPAIKTLALAFLVMVGASLIAESLDVHVPRAYLYGSMALSAAIVWTTRLRLRRQG
jgi:predicted tellurium resistance membrane protein TerC